MKMSFSSKTPKKCFGNKITLREIAIMIAIFVSCAILIHFMNNSMAISKIVLEIVSPQHEDMYQLFYDTGKGFNEAESVRQIVNKGDGIKDVIFCLPLSLGQIKSIRIDPGSQPTSIKVKSIKLISNGKEYLWGAAEILKNFKPVMDVDNFSEKERLLYINSTSIDPAFVSIFGFNRLFESNITFVQILFYLLAVIISVLLFKMIPSVVQVNNILKAIIISSAILIFTVLFYVIFSPPFLSWDSYHYMVLSFYPETGAIHPPLFGFILRLISVITRELWENAFVHLFILFNVLCFFSIGWIILREFDHHTVISLAQRILFAVLILLVTVFVVPALFFLMNGFWTEMTSFLFIALISLFLSREYTDHSKLNVSLIVLFCFLAFHLRHQFIMLPLAILGVAFIFYLRNLKSNIHIFLKWIYVTVFMFLVMFGSNYVASIFLPTTNDANYLQSLSIQTNIQCQLKCEVSLFEKDCSTDENKQLVLKTTLVPGLACGMLIGNGTLGSSKLGVTSITSILKTIGFSNTISWLIKSPLNYLKQKYHFLEYEMFRFDKNIRFLSQHHDVMEYYGNLISTGDKLTNGSFAFQKLIQWVSYANSNLSTYHFLVAIVVLASLITIWLSPNPVSVFLALVCIGNFLIFSYFNPQVTVRYLIQILVPGIMSLLISLTYRPNFYLVTHPNTIMGVNLK